jgi:hypothetical protein
MGDCPEVQSRRKEADVVHQMRLELEEETGAAPTTMVARRGVSAG